MPLCMINPGRFILIDDESVANMLAEIAIKKVFENSAIFKFTEPETGLEFIKEECNHKPVETVIFLDINMPKLSGWDVLRVIEALPAQATCFFDIYIVSSSVDPADKEKAENSGLVKGYLEKPVSRAILQHLFAA